MAQMGTSFGLAKQPAMGFGRALLTAIVVLAIGAGLVAATSFLATANRGIGVPTADHSYDQIENLRGAANFSVAGDRSYDQIEKHRAGTAALQLPLSAFPASARDYRSASKPEIAPTTAFPLPQSAYPASARDYRSASKPEIGPTTPSLADGVRER
jgi:hypothetical protein